MLVPVSLVIWGYIVGLWPMKEREKKEDDRARGTGNLLGLREPWSGLEQTEGSSIVQKKPNIVPRGGGSIGKHSCGVCASLQVSKASTHIKSWAQSHTLVTLALEPSDGKPGFSKRFCL